MNVFQHGVITYWSVQLYKQHRTRRKSLYDSRAHDNYKVYWLNIFNDSIKTPTYTCWHSEFHSPLQWNSFVSTTSTATWQLKPPPYFRRIKLHQTCIKRCVLPVAKLATVRESQKVQRIGYAGKNPIFTKRITCAISDDKITAKTWLSRVTEAGSDHLQKQ